MKIKKISDAILLPDEWDNLADCFFQRRKFLLHCQAWNPCNQRYYLGYNDDKLAAVGVVYTLRLNLFTYFKMNLPLKIHIAGIPCSVSSPGLLGESANALQLFEYICLKEKGLKVALNLENINGVSKKMFEGNTLPVINFANSFSDWDEYLELLRADYRRRLLMTEKKSSLVRFSSSSCSDFSDDMYEQYLQVYNKSKAKLERLDYQFFRQLPEEFILTSAEIDNKTVGWFITLYSDNELYFLFGGFDYLLNVKYQIYHRLLIEIIRQGINSGAKRINLGQTAEISKMRLGGKCEIRYMIAMHENNIFQAMLCHSTKLLEYKNSFPEHHVFREVL